jgi:hypothetical protein
MFPHRPVVVGLRFRPLAPIIAGIRADGFDRTGNVQEELESPPVDIGFSISIQFAQRSVVRKLMFPIGYF